MSVAKGLLGGSSKSSSKETVSRAPRQFYRVFENGRNIFSSNPDGPQTSRISFNLDPLIGTLRNEALSGFRGLREDVQGDIARLRGLENPFIRARVRPLEERLAQSRSFLEENLGKTGIRGSFRDRSLRDFDISAAKEVADQNALAEIDILDAVANRQNLGRALTGDVERIGQQLLQSELSKLGLSAAAQQTILQSQFPESTKRETKSPGSTSGLGSLLYSFGSAGIF